MKEPFRQTGFGASMLVIIEMASRTPSDREPLQNAMWNTYP